MLGMPVESWEIATKPRIFTSAEFDFLELWCFQSLFLWLGSWAASGSSSDLTLQDPQSYTSCSVWYRPIYYHHQCICVLGIIFKHLLTGCHGRSRSQLDSSWFSNPDPVDHLQLPSRYDKRLQLLMTLHFVLANSNLSRIDMSINNF